MIKLAITFSMLALLFGCKGQDSNKVDITFPVPKYCENTIEKNIFDIGIQKLGVDLKIVQFDINTSLPPIGKYAVLTGAPAYREQMKRVAETAIFKCSPDSSRVFESDHPLVKQLSKEINKDITKLGEDIILVEVYNGKLVIYFDDEFDAPSLN